MHDDTVGFSSWSDTARRQPICVIRPLCPFPKVLPLFQLPEDEWQPDHGCMPETVAPDGAAARREIPIRSCGTK